MSRIVLAIAVVAVLVAVTPARAKSDGRCEARADVTGLPLIELPSKIASDRFAIMISGDGGWRRIDTKVTDRLRSAGVPVVGVLAPEYFRQRRTAEESACALERIIRTYQIRWKRSRVVLIGYSRGADVLPFMASRLPHDLQAQIDAVALLGLESTIDFRYHASWIPFYHPSEPQFAVRPEVEKLRGHNVLCFFGIKEKDSLCHQLDPKIFTIVGEPGGHHFGGQYHDIAEAILASIR